MKVYQVHYIYGSNADDERYYGGMNGKIYTNKEACEAEAKYMMDTSDCDEWYVDIPEEYIIREIEVLDSFKKGRR